MFGLDGFYLIFLFILTLIIAIFAGKVVDKVYAKLCLYLFIVGFFIYSGIGICYEMVSKIYLIQYFLFGICFCASFGWSTKVAYKYKAKENKFIFQKKVTKTIAILFWILMFIKLVYPVNRIGYLFNINISIVDILYNKDDISMLIYVINLIILLIRPVYYIYLYLECSTKKTVCLLLLEIYVGIAINGYIARSGLISQIIFIILIIISMNNEKLLEMKKNKDINIKKYLKVLGFLFILIIIAMPVLYEYQYYRLGVEYKGSAEAIDKIEQLLSIEFSFPKLYRYCNEYHSIEKFFEYMVYIITLVIPKKIFGITSTILVNNEISMFISGVSYGSTGFTIYLPGLLGEGIILLGNNMSFLFGIVLGGIIGLIFSFVEKYKQMTIWVLYLSINVMLMCRGGSQGTVSLFINGSLLIFITSFFDRLKIK